jgi:hypothetical protein
MITAPVQSLESRIVLDGSGTGSQDDFINVEQKLTAAVANLQLVVAQQSVELQQASQSAAQTRMTGLASAGAQLNASDAASTAARIQRDAADAAQLESALQGIATQRMSAGQAHLTVNQQTQAEAEAGFQQSLTSTLAALDAARATTQANLTTSIAAINLANDAAWDAADNVYDLQMAAISSGLTSATAGIDAVWIQTQSAATATRDNARQAATAQRASQLQANAAMLASVSSATPSFDPAVIANDPAWQSAVQAAGSQWTQGLQQIEAVYVSAVAAAETAFDASVASAAAAYDAAVQAAEQDRLNARASAQQSYDQRIMAASQARVAAEQAAAAARDAAVMQAQQTLTAAQQAADLAYQQAVLEAEMTRTSAIAQADALFNNGSFALSQSFELANMGRWEGYASDLETFATGHNSTVAGLQQAYESAVGVADQNFKEAIAEASEALWWARFKATNTWLLTQSQQFFVKYGAFTAYWIAESAWYAAHLYSQDPPPFPESIKNIARNAAHVFSVEGAAAAVAYEDAMKGPLLAAARADAGAQETMGLAVGNASNALAVGTANAIYSFAVQSANRRADYLRSSAQAESGYALAQLDLEYQRETAVLAAELQYAITVVNADAAKSLAGIAASFTHEVSVINAYRTHELALNEASRTEAIEGANAFEDLLNDQTAADLQYVVNVAAAALPFGTAVLQATAALTTQLVEAGITRTNAAAALRNSISSSVEHSRHGILSALHAGDVTMLTTVSAFRQHQLTNIADDAALFVAEAAAEAEWASTLTSAWLTAEIQKLNASIQAMVAEAAAVANWRNDVAAADKQMDIDSINAVCDANTQDIASQTTAQLAVETALQILETAGVIADWVYSVAESNADAAAGTAELAAHDQRLRAQVASDLIKALADIDDFQTTTLEVARIERDHALELAATILTKLPARLAAEKQVMTAVAEKRIQDNYLAALAHQSEVAARPLSYYDLELLQMSNTFDSVLNSASNFFNGWVNAGTAGVYMSLLSPTGYLDQIDPNSTAFAAGSIAGAVHLTLLGFASGSGACQVGRTVTIVRAYMSATTVVGVAKTTVKAWTEGVSSLTVFDYLELAPAAGKALSLLNRMCFVAGTPVVVDLKFSGIEPFRFAFHSPAGPSGWRRNWAIAGGLMLVAHLLVSRRQRGLTEVPQRRSVVERAAVLPNPESLDEVMLTSWWSAQDDVNWLSYPLARLAPA